MRMYMYMYMCMCMCMCTSSSTPMCMGRCITGGVVGEVKKYMYIYVYARIHTCIFICISRNRPVAPVASSGLPSLSPSDKLSLSAYTRMQVSLCVSLSLSLSLSL